MHILNSLKKTSICFILMVLFSFAIAYAQNERPQEPKPPYTYSSEDVIFLNIKADSIALAGTLTPDPS